MLLFLPLSTQDTCHSPQYTLLRLPAQRACLSCWPHLLNRWRSAVLILMMLAHSTLLAQTGNTAAGGTAVSPVPKQLNLLYSVYTDGGGKVYITDMYAHRRQWDSCYYLLQKLIKLYRFDLINPDFGLTLRDQQYLKRYDDIGGGRYYQAINNLLKAYTSFDSLTSLNNQISKRYNARQVLLAEQKLLLQKHQVEVEVMENQMNTQRLLFWMSGLALIALVFFSRDRFVRLKLQHDRVINAEKEKSLRFEKQLIDDELQRAKAELAVFINYMPEKKPQIYPITPELANPAQPEQKVNEQHLFNEARQHLLNFSLHTNDDWDEFRRRFEQVHPGFFGQLRNHLYDISPAEERFLALSKLRVNTRQMSRMLGISPDSIRKTKYRMRKKIGINGASHLIELLAD